MLDNTNQKMEFNQFLFSHFNIISDENVNSTVTEEEAKIFELEKLHMSKEEVARIVLEKKIVTDRYDKKADLAEVINSIPQEERKFSSEEMVHKHESEWYHTFRDLQDKIADDLSKKHPNHNGILKFKNEIKEFWEQLDDVIEKGALEVELVFQVFPNMSRVAVIYLLSLMIALPLVFFSTNQDAKVSVIDQAVVDPSAVAQRQINISDEMKSDYIARNSAKILGSGSEVIQVTRSANAGRVAGAYEDSYKKQTDNELKRKISAWYNLFSELKDELTFVINSKLAK